MVLSNLFEVVIPFEFILIEVIIMLLLIIILMLRAVHISLMNIRILLTTISSYQSLGFLMFVDC
jgi:hypothetical protein